MGKKILVLVIMVLVLVSSIQYAAALEARIRGARMVLQTLPGERIERSILVMNPNDIPVVIELSATGDLADKVKLRDDSFELEPGEEKKAYFTIRADRPGVTETSINIKYVPEEGNGVGFSSTVILVTKGEVFDSGGDEEEEIEEDVENEDGGFSFNPSGRNLPGSTSDRKLSPIAYLLGSSVLLGLALIGIMVYANKVKSKKRVRRTRE